MAQDAKQLPQVGHYDVRLIGRTGIDPVLAANAGPGASPAATRAAGREAFRSQTLATQQAFQRLLREVPSASPEIRYAPQTATPELLSGVHGPLSAPAAGAGIDVVRAFLHGHRDLYGLSDREIDALHPIGESVSPSGLRMVRVEQRVNDLPVFQSETRFLLDAEGRIWRVLGQLMPSSTLASAAAAPAAPALGAGDALVRAMDSVGITLQASALQTRSLAANGRRVELRSDDPQLGGPVASDLVFFPLVPGTAVLAWRQVTFTSGDADWYTVVDAASGALLWRKDIREAASTEEARFSVYVQADGTTPADSPAPASPNNVVPGSGTQFAEISRTTVAMSAAQDLGASPNGWIPDGDSTTTGNNVDAYLDAVQGGGETNVPDIGALDNNGRPVGNLDMAMNNRDFLGAAPNDFGYTPAPVGGNPDMGDAPTNASYQRGSVTQLFYLTNWYHDQLFNLGFDEAAGNFQQTNFSAMGVGGDRVLAEAQDGSGTNNANFATPPDGMSGRMQMYRFTFPSPDRDGDLDAEVVLHELTHGLSNRLIGNAGGLVWSVGRGMGEGWSDFYALSLLNNTNADDPDARYASGGYATYSLGGLTDNYVYGIRRFPYSTDNTVNPLTWGDTDDVTVDYSGGIPISPLGFQFNGALEVHNVGEVWALTLWEVRSRVIADPAGANGDVPTGNHTMLQLVTDALKLTPSNPSYTDARDALLLADCMTNACANELSIWQGFADRGLGYGAVAPLGQMGFANFGHMSVGESFALPRLDNGGVSIDDSSGNANGAIDPGEPIRLSVDLLNPWQGASFALAGATATLSSATPGVTILDNAASYGAIAPGGTTAGDAFVFLLSPAATCGQSLRFTVETTSALGTTSFDVTLRVGMASGTGAPVTYTSMPSLAIPDNDPRGTFDTMTITDDLEIADLDFRLDSLTHTYTGDLTVMLRGPNGYGGDLIWLRGLLFGGAFANGDNFVDTVIDGASVNDLNQTVPANAPFTGDWLPAFNSPVWNLFASPDIFPDPVDQLSRFNGLSTQGDWMAFVADYFAPDSGTLDSWSLIVTPTAFTCTGFAPSVDLTANKTVSGSFLVGGAVSYTVTLTNNGTGIQADNPGDEFTDVLPVGLTLVSASATSGAAVATVATNTVTWNGSLAPLGGSVTITINATIDAGTDGSTLLNQGTLAFDADVNGTNEAAGVTDDPGTPAADDPTALMVAGAANVSGTKTVSGPSAPGATITYTVVLSNNGTGVQADNPGDEFTDVLPVGLTLVSASATSGTAVATVATNTVTWNGSIPVAGSVTITIQATIDAGTEGQVLDNQGAIAFDSIGDGANDAAAVTDDPSTAPVGDATSLVVRQPTIEIPTLSGFGLLLLLLGLGVLPLTVLQRQR